MFKSTVALALLLCFAGSSQAQDEVRLSNQASTTKPIPDYLLFKHFLAWVKDLDRKATARGVVDRYEFAAPFATGAKLEERHIDAVREEAYSLDEDLSKHDTKAAAFVAAFRATAKSALLRGGQCHRRRLNFMNCSKSERHSSNRTFPF